MNAKEFDLILQEGEGQFIEFKESFDKSLSKEIVAFANASGGKIFLGICDDKTIKKINVTNKLKSQIQDIARGCDPSINVKLENYDDVLIVKINPGKNKPYSCKTGFFLRVGANSQKLSREEIIKFSLSSFSTSFDKIVNEQAVINEELDFEVAQKFVKKYIADIDVDSNLLKSLKLSDSKNLTNAGVLFFGKNPKFFIPSAYTDCLLFKGTNKVDIIDRKTFEKNILEQLDGALKFLKRHINLSYEFKGELRIEKYEIPIRAIEEAIVNALIHRDYTFSGANISIEIYDDRIEITNPGKLLDGIDEKNFGKISLRRNEILADVFSRTPYVEKVGSGISRIKNLCRKNNNDLKFEFDHFFKLIIYKHKMNPKNEKKR